MASRANCWYEVAVQIVLVALLLCAASSGEMNCSSINIGPIIALDTTNGKIAKTAIELAVEDVNRNTSILNGTILRFISENPHKMQIVVGCCVMNIEALELIREGCVSIVGPQTSLVAEFVGYLGVAAHVPIVTFGARNPSLSMHRYPYLIRTVPNDKMQMRAIAKLIEEYRWRDVAFVYDDMGTGAIPANKRCLARCGGKNCLESCSASPGQRLFNEKAS
ncbi:hypothetical protein SUGI_0857800 [Cryptomeria japonica]|nr:hypothetical protein SUGI_0857800 [Cryptomeria japonica]